MEIPVSASRYALIVRVPAHKTKPCRLNLVHLQTYEEDEDGHPDTYWGVLIDKDGERTSPNERQFPARDIVRRWETLPYPEEIERAKRAFVNFRQREGVTA